MEWLDRFNEAINYIEQRLDDEIDFEKAANIACCSTYHFQRMFSYIADIPLSEYIRRRRMSKAAIDLQSGDVKIIDIALRYGYDSPTAFNRAFQNIHGIAPSAAKTLGTTLKSFPPISLRITIKGDVEMNYKIEKKDTFKIIGVKKHYSASIEECFASVPIFWQETIKRGLIPKLCILNNCEPYGVIGLSTCMDSRNFDYFVAVASDKECPANMYEYIVPECTWAVFECIGAMPDAMQNLQKRIVTEWLPSSGYEYANAPDIEVYFEGNQTAADYKCEAWLPIIKK